MEIIKVNITEEKRITLGFILSNRFHRNVHDFFELDYITNVYLKQISSLCIEFFNEFQDAPKKAIKDIFFDYSKNLESAEKENMKNILRELYTQISDGINVDYYIQVAKEYCQKRFVQIHINNMQLLDEKEDYEQAEQLILQYNTFADKMSEGVILDMDDDDVYERLFDKLVNEDSNFFKFPGAVGKYLGNMKRGDVVGYVAPQKRGKCVSENSLITLSDGTLKTIKEVVQKKIVNVLCKNEKDKIVKGKVIDWMYCGEKTEYEVTTKSGRKTKVAIDHKFYTPMGYKKLQDLQVGDRVGLCKHKPCYSHKIVKKSELRILAYLLADGHLGEGMSFTKHSPNVMADFCKNLHETDKYTIFDNGCILRLHRTQTYRFIQKLGLQYKLSADKFIPDFVLKSNNKSISEFLNVLFTCDGSIWKDRNCVQIDYSTKSFMLCNQVVSCLSRFNIFGKIRERIVNNTKYYEIILSSNKSIIAFMKHIGFSFHKVEKAKKLTFELVDKRDYIDVIPHEYVLKYGKELRESGKGFNNESFRIAFNTGKHVSKKAFKRTVGDQPVLHTDLLWDSIKSIKKLGKVKMYDLEVAEHHNFISDSFIVHNSFWLIEHLAQAVAQKRKTVFWSVEMTEVEIFMRVLKAFYPMINMDEAREFSDNHEYPFPELDCKLNQNGDCNNRESTVIVLDGDDMPMFDKKHVPCKKCKGTDKYKYTLYTSYMKRPILEKFEGYKIKEKFKRLFKKYIKISVHPKYSLSYQNMISDLSKLARTKNFVPDKLIIDYIDILKMDSSFDDYRLVDEQWKLLAQLAGETKTLVVTATQANKAGLDSTRLNSSHQGGFYGKSRHVNLMVGINQTAEQKEQGIIELGITDRREGFFSENESCLVLQDLKTGQAHLEGLIVYNTKGKYV